MRFTFIRPLVIRARDTAEATFSDEKEENQLHLIWTLIIGLIVGAVAKLLMPGKDPGGIFITIILGIAGAFVGTFIGQALGLYREGQSAGFIMSVLGAIILLAIYRLFKRGSPA
jgi:uncharacterized membrane protein YeaQ/YmgE (transglycosylase-associated protein family)